jgi:hypothetical protein
MRLIAAWQMYTAPVYFNSPDIRNRYGNRIVHIAAPPLPPFWFSYHMITSHNILRKSMGLHGLPLRVRRLHSNV